MRRRIDQPFRVRVLGRLPALTAVAGLAGALTTSCDTTEKKPPAVTTERSQAVAAPVGATAPTPASATASTPPAAKKPPRKLCAGELDKPARAFPDKSMSRATAPGSAEYPARPKLAGSWTWVNFWAAWCVPCKEEMPRLKAWEKKLRDAGKPFNIVFVTLDDDARQLDDFLKAQSEGGVRSTYWLKEGKEREQWLSAAEIEEDPELPTHLLLDPQGKVRCRVKGAVEDADYASLAAIVGG